MRPLITNLGVALAVLAPFALADYWYLRTGLASIWNSASVNIAALLLAPLAFLWTNRRLLANYPWPRRALVVGGLTVCLSAAWFVALVWVISKNLQVAFGG
jgi:hypothetical protein